MERDFLHALSRYMKLVRSDANIDLFEYFKAITDSGMTEGTRSDFLHVDVHELCMLRGSKSHCERREHHKEKKCPAYQMVATYHLMKDTVLFNTVRHMPSASIEYRADSSLEFRVTKIDRRGRELKRILSVVPPAEDDSGSLLTFRENRSRKQLRRAFPLSQLVQVDQSGSDERKLTLLFTSQGACMGRVYERGDGDGRGACRQCCMCIVILHVLSYLHVYNLMVACW